MFELYIDDALWEKLLEPVSMLSPVGYFEKRNKHLATFGARYKKGTYPRVLIFDTDADRTLFLLKFS